jgi:hypothetical protein
VLVIVEREAHLYYFLCSSSSSSGYACCLCKRCSLCVCERASEPARARWQKLERAAHRSTCRLGRQVHGNGMVQRYVRTPRVIASSPSPRRRSSSPLFISSCLVHRAARISIRVSIDAIGAEQSKRGERQVDPRMHAGADADAGTLRHSITYPVSQPASHSVSQSVSSWSAFRALRKPSSSSPPVRLATPRHAQA